jgi:hypothetical protein
MGFRCKHGTSIQGITYIPGTPVSEGRTRGCLFKYLLNLLLLVLVRQWLYISAKPGFYLPPCLRSCSDRVSSAPAIVSRRYRLVCIYFLAVRQSCLPWWRGKHAPAVWPIRRLVVASVSGWQLLYIRALDWLTNMCKTQMIGTLQLFSVDSNADIHTISGPILKDNYLFKWEFEVCIILQLGCCNMHAFVNIVNCVNANIYFWKRKQCIHITSSFYTCICDLSWKHNNNVIRHLWSEDSCLTYCKTHGHTLGIAVLQSDTSRTM